MAETAICPKCFGDARVTRGLVEREAGTFTSITTRCLNPQCGEESTAILPGDHR